MNNTATAQQVVRDDRDAAIRALHLAEPELSQRQIAERIGTSPRAVNQAIKAAAAKPVPISHDPNVIDSELRREARSIAGSMIRFKEFIERAKTQRIHETLGFKSWPAYVADVINTEMGRLDIDTRRDLVTLLASEDMSQRAIAAAVGVSQSTVRDDIAEVSRNYSPDEPTESEVSRNYSPDEPTAPTVTGLDGKKQPATKPKPTPPRAKQTHRERLQTAVQKIGALVRTVDTIGALDDSITAADAAILRETLSPALAELERIDSALVVRTVTKPSRHLKGVT